MRIDVILLLYNRPEHTRKVLESIADNGIKQVRAYLDYPVKSEDLVKQQKILSIIGDFDRCDIELVQRAKKFGLAKSVRCSMNEAFVDGADAAVLLEDDCVIHPDGFTFFKQGLRSLKGNRKIRSLCGYNFPSCNFIFEPESDLLLLSRFSTWGWATWSDRWEQYEPDLSKLVNFAKQARLYIDEFAGDLSQLCKSEKYLTGKADIWSINWILLHYITSTFAVYPKESVIKNIGLDGSGSNCMSTDIFHSDKENHISNDYNWDNLQYYPENEIIIKEFMDKNGLKTYPNP